MIEFYKRNYVMKWNEMMWCDVIIKLMEVKKWHQNPTVIQKHQIETKEKKSSIFVIFGKTIIFKPFSSHGSHPFESEKAKKNKEEILSYNSSSEICYFYKNAMLDVICVCDELSYTRIHP